MNDTERKAKEIFASALEEPAEARTAIIDEACDGDAHLRREVEALFDALERSGDFLERPAIESSRVHPRPCDDRTWIGRRVGQFTIRSVLAAGGMGVVYLAEQEQPRRTVALKMLRSPFPSRSAVRRFTYEAEVLGRLQHPNIAQIYEAGVHAADGSHGSGTPYFAMEFIDGGVGLIEDAERRHRDVRERLELFVEVCHAVHHAHQKGVIHRDLKPSNILIEPGLGRPKIIDFGIARAIELEGPLAHTATSGGQIIGTLQYASPEQCAGDAAALDVRTDVYSLGAILYELLAHQPALDLRKTSLMSAMQMVHTVEPARLGTIHKSLRGDLETIVHKAMHKDREQRYRSAAALADDLVHYLRSEPIAARPPSAIYHAGKFCRRNRVLVGGAAASIMILTGGLIAISIALAGQAEQRANAVKAQQTAELRERDAEAARAAESAARRRAVEFADAADAHAAFVSRVLQSVNPWTPGAGAVAADAGMLRTLDLAAVEVETSYVGQPLSEGAVRLSIGKTYRGVGRLNEAEMHVRKALDLFADHVGDECEYTIASLVELAAIEDDRGRFAGARALLDRADAAAASVPDLDPVVLTGIKNSLARSAIRAGNAVEAEAFARDAIRISAARSPFNEAAATSRLALADALAHQRRFAEAEPMYRELLELRGRDLGPDHLSTLVVEHNLAGLLIRSGRPRDAKPLLEHVLGARRLAVGEQHPMTLMAMNDLTVVYIDLDLLDSAETLGSEALERHTTHLGDAHPFTGTARSNLAHIRLRRGEFDSCAQLLEESIDIAKAQSGGDDPNVLMFRFNLGIVYRQAKKFDEAEATLREVVAARTRVAGLHDAYTRAAQHQLAEVLLEVGRAADARCIIDQQIQEERAARDFAYLPALLRAADADCLAMEGAIDAAVARYHESIRMLAAATGLANLRARHLIERAAAFFEKNGRIDDAERARALIAADGS